MNGDVPSDENGLEKYRNLLKFVSSHTYSCILPKRGGLLDFGTGVLISSNFLRPPNNQTTFTKTSNTQLVKL